ncbi:MAG: FecR domain-containing protein [Candidatus Humimicrobiaceae bacterium]
MKKRYLGILIILISFLLTFAFSNSVSADNSNLIHGVVPTKVTATMSGKTKNGTFYFNYEFWNVGELGGDQYSKVTVASYFSENESKNVQEGSFTGGPNGDIYIQGSTSQIHLKLHDGNVITNESGESFPIDNPQAFDGWVDEELITEPTIKLLILEGPVALNGGKLRWTVKANVSGNPAPTVEFSGEGVSATDNENVVNITVEKGKIFELTATASNWYGEKTASMTFVNEDSLVRFSDLSGQVEIRPDNDEVAWDFAKLDSVLMVDMHVKTGDNSTAILSFADMTTFVMKPQSEIILSSPAAKDSQIELLGGKLWVNIKKMMKDGSMEIECSQAVLGIKGTRLIINETGSESTVKVTEGTVQFKLKNSSQSVAVSKGQSVTASNNGLSEKTSFDPVEEEKSWEAIGGKTVEVNKELQSISKTSAGPGILIIIPIVFAFLLAAAIVILVLVFRSRKNKQAVSDLQIYPNIKPPQPASYCRYCGKPVNAGSRFCSKCGNKIN